MNFWKEGIYSWGHFITVLLILIGVFFLLKLVIRIGKNIGAFGQTQERVIGFFRLLLIGFEPIALVILIGIFVMISPLFHGTILTLLLLANIAVIRSYFMGRMIQFEKSIMVGSPISTGDLKGTVINMNRIGLRMRTIDGIQFLNYLSLIHDGYLISNLDQVGGNYLVSIEDNRKEPEKKMRQELLHVLRSSPFIEPEKKIKIDIGETENVASVSLAIRNKDHLQELIGQLREHGFSTRIINI